MSQETIAGVTGTVNGSGQLTTYNVPGSVVIPPYSVSVQIDGTGASGNFLPCLSFYSQTGQLIARCPAPEVASGDTGEVSWFPHVAAATSSGGSGIQFDTDNEGGWLDVTTNNTDGAGFGMFLQDKTGGGIGIESGPTFFPQAGSITLGSDGVLLGSFPAVGKSGTIEISQADGGIVARASGTYGVSISTSGSGLISISGVAGTTVADSHGLELQTSPTEKVGFFGATPVVQQATPVTLANVISLLQAYGLSA